MRLTEDNYVEIAETAIKDICERKDQRGNKGRDLVTTSKIRNLLAMSADIYNEVIISQKEVLSKEIIGRINYMKIRFIYDAGREKKVGIFLQQTKLLEYLEGSKEGRTQYILFNRYMEALEAYRKYYGELYGNRDE